jgi:hypothetical protein
VFVKDEKSEKEIEKYWIASVPEIESRIVSESVALESIHTPTSFTPAITTSSSKTQMFGESSQSFVQEKLQDVLTRIEAQKQAHATNLMEHRSLLSKIKSNFYSYALNAYLQAKFENVTESLFQKTKLLVDEKLQKICPDAMKKLVAAYNRVDSQNQEEWSQAMSSCRNVLKEFADSVFPARNEKYKRKDGTELVITDDKYKNRLIAYIEENEKRTNKKYLQDRATDLIERIHSLHDILSKGTHAEIDIEFVNICIIDTYLVLGSMINYT